MYLLNHLNNQTVQSKEHDLLCHVECKVWHILNVLEMCLLETYNVCMLYCISLCCMCITWIQWQAGTELYCFHQSSHVRSISSVRHRFKQYSTAEPKDRWRTTSKPHNNLSTKLITTGTITRCLTPVQSWWPNPWLAVGAFGRQWFQITSWRNSIRQ